MTQPELTPEQQAERARRADGATRGALAGVLGLEALVVLLVPRALAASHSLGTPTTLILVGLAILMIAAAGTLRKPYGVAVGSAMQVLLMLTGVLILAMFVLGVIFWAVWYRLLALRRDVVGTPRGWRMLIS